MLKNINRKFKSAQPKQKTKPKKKNNPKFPPPPIPNIKVNWTNTRSRTVTGLESKIRTGMESTR